MSRGAVAAIFLVFALAGPVFGGLLLGLLLGVHMALTQPGMPATLPLFASIMLLPLAFLGGGLQALATAILTAMASWWRGRLAWLVALATASVTGAIIAAREHVADDPGFTVVLFAAHLGAAALCVLVCRLMLGRGKPAAA